MKTMVNQSKAILLSNILLSINNYISQVTTTNVTKQQKKSKLKKEI